MAADALTLANTRLDAEVVEMPLLLPRWQADALEDAARRRGMTTGQMLRRVIADLFSSTASEVKR